MFKVGQQVLCTQPDHYGLLVKAKEYIVRDITFAGGIKVKGVKSEGVHNGYFHQWRFSKKDENSDKQEKELSNVTYDDVMDMMTLSKSKVAD